MVAYVRVRSSQELLAHVLAKGTQTEVAASAGMQLARLNAIVRGKAPVIPARRAAALEQALGVPLGTLFASEEPELMARYCLGSYAPVPAGQLDAHADVGTTPNTEPAQPADPGTA